MHSKASIYRPLARIPIIKGTVLFRGPLVDLRIMTGWPDSIQGASSNSNNNNHSPRNLAAAHLQQRFLRMHKAKFSLAHRLRI